MRSFSAKRPAGRPGQVGDLGAGAMAESLDDRGHLVSRRDRSGAGRLCRGHQDAERWGGGLEARRLRHGGLELAHHRGCEVVTEEESPAAVEEQLPRAGAQGGVGRVEDQAQAQTLSVCPRRGRAPFEGVSHTPGEQGVEEVTAKPRGVAAREGVAGGLDRSGVGPRGVLEALDEPGQVRQGEGWLEVRRGAAGGGGEDPGAKSAVTLGFEAESEIPEPRPRPRGPPGGWASAPLGVGEKSRADGADQLREVLGTERDAGETQDDPGLFEREGEGPTVLAGAAFDLLNGILDLDPADPVSAQLPQEVGESLEDQRRQRADHELRGTESSRAVARARFDPLAACDPIHQGLDQIAGGGHLRGLDDGHRLPDQGLGRLSLLLLGEQPGDRAGPWCRWVGRSHDDDLPLGSPGAGFESRPPSRAGGRGTRPREVSEGSDTLAGALLRRAADPSGGVAARPAEADRNAGCNACPGSRAASRLRVAERRHGVRPISRRAPRFPGPPRGRAARVDRAHARHPERRAVLRPGLDLPPTTPACRARGSTG